MLVKQKEDAKRKLEEATAGAEAAEQLAASKTREIEEAEATLASEKARATERREAEAAARAAEKAANETTREIRGKLEQRRVAADSERSKGVIVQALMAAKAKGKIKGVLGRLGDLGAIDKKTSLCRRRAPRSTTSWWRPPPTRRRASLTSAPITSAWRRSSSSRSSRRWKGACARRPRRRPRRSPRRPG